MTRWSMVRLNVSTFLLFTASPSRYNSSSTAFIPRIAACGRSIIGVNDVIPYIPRLVTVNVAPYISSGFRDPSRARVASSILLWVRFVRGSAAAFRITGTTSPFSSATAIPILISLKVTRLPSRIVVRMYGASRRARDVARTRRSVSGHGRTRDSYGKALGYQRMPAGCSG